MTEEQKVRLEELREMQFQSHQKESIIQKLENRLRPDLYQILDPETKDLIKDGTDDWPRDKWEKNLYVQTEITNTGIIFTILSRFLVTNLYDYSYVVLSGYYSLILRVSNQTLLDEWTTLIEADGDGITCYIPGSKDYICIELVQETLVGKEDLGVCWLYELTFSNERIQAELLQESA